MLIERKIVPKLYFNEQQIHETITIVLGDDGMVADEVIACLKKDMNEHLVLALVEVDKKSTYDDIIRGDDSEEMFFMDSKSNWNNGKTYEDLKEEALEDMLMGSLIKGEMGFA